MKSTYLRHTTAFALAGMLTTGPAAFAAQPPNGPGGHLRITEVAVEFGEFDSSDSLTITGEHFDFDDISDLVVTLGDPANGWGDITGFCTSPSPHTQIVCNLPAGLPDNGDYLLTVSTGGGQSQSDEYDLTIGTVGLPGADGQDGAPGANGQDGAPCRVTECSAEGSAEGSAKGVAQLICPTEPETSVDLPCIPNVDTASR